jgi:hypothetical protein
MQLTERRIILLLGGLLIASIGVVALCYYQGIFQRRVVACRITIGAAEGMSIVLDDPAQIEDLVLRPIRLARPDFEPGDYMVFGDLVLEYEDGAVGSYWLFFPFGCYKKGERSYVADFGKLKREVKRRIQGKKGMERLIKHLDYRP